MAQPKIFVSHSREDDTFATRLVADLRRAGVDAWMDTTDMGAGNFQQRISEALNGCEWFIVVLTRSALASPWVRQEVDAANRLKHLGQIHDLIFIKAGPVEHLEVPPLWGVYNIFDATVDYAAARDSALKAVGLAVRKSPTRKRAKATSRAPEPQEWVPESISERLSEGRYAEALEEAETFLQRHPNDISALTYKARALLGLGRGAEAQATGKRAEVLFAQQIIRESRVKQQ